MSDPSLEYWGTGIGDTTPDPTPPAAWRASTLRLIADHFYPETPEKKVIISPSHKMREEWAIFLRDEADRLEE